MGPPASTRPGTRRLSQSRERLPPRMEGEWASGTRVQGSQGSELAAEGDCNHPQSRAHMRQLRYKEACISA